MPTLCGFDLFKKSTIVRSEHCAPSRAASSRPARVPGYPTELKELFERLSPRAEARLIHVGARVATAEGKLTDAAGRIYAHGTSTCLRFPL